VLGFGVGDYAGEPFDWALEETSVRRRVYLLGEVGWRLTRTTTPPQPRPL
jgi:hypothetical protein